MRSCHHAYRPPVPSPRPAPGHGGRESAQWLCLVIRPGRTRPRDGPFSHRPAPSGLPETSPPSIPGGGAAATPLPSACRRSASCGPGRSAAPWRRRTRRDSRARPPHSEGPFLEAQKPEAAGSRRAKSAREDRHTHASLPPRTRAMLPAAVTLPAAHGRRTRAEPTVAGYHAVPRRVALGTEAVGPLEPAAHGLGPVGHPARAVAPPAGKPKPPVREGREDRHPGTRHTMPKNGWIAAEVGAPKPVHVTSFSAALRLKPAYLRAFWLTDGAACDIMLQGLTTRAP